MQYKTGTVSVTNGNAVVTGSGTTWLGNVPVGSVFSVSASGVPYVVGSVDSNTQITLASNYAGATNSGLAYAITTSFTPNQQLAYPDQGDIDTHTILKRAFLILDAILTLGIGSVAVANRMVYSDAAGKLTTQGGTTISVQMAGGTQFAFTNMASAVNYMQATGHVTANSPSLSSAGSDANVGVTLGTKGSGGLGVSTGGAVLLQFLVSHIANAVNRVSVAGAATTSPPIVSADGSDANVNFFLGSKASGTVFLVTNTGGGAPIAFAATHVASAINYLQASGAAAGNPNLSSNGAEANVPLGIWTKGSASFFVNTGGFGAAYTQFKIEHVASAVNCLQVYGNVTGAGPDLSAIGSDAAANVNYITKGAGSHRFFTNSAGVVEQARILHAPSAVNYFQVAGAAAGGNIDIAPQGSDADIQLSLTAKGADPLIFFTGGFARAAVQIVDVASSINYLELKASVTGNAVQLSAQGADANIDLAVLPKGSGRLKFGSFTASGDVAVNGSVEIRDSGGTLRKLATIA